MSELEARPLSFPNAEGVDLFGPLPDEVGTWTQVEIGARTYLAHATLRISPERKYTLVVYRQPNISAHYVRGESLTSFGEAFARVRELMAIDQLDAGGS